MYIYIYVHSCIKCMIKSSACTLLQTSLDSFTGTDECKFNEELHREARFSIRSFERIFNICTCEIFPRYIDFRPVLCFAGRRKIFMNVSHLRKMLLPLEYVRSLFIHTPRLKRSDSHKYTQSSHSNLSWEGINVFLGLVTGTRNASVRCY